ncbi:C6 finger domain protein [Aspergillus terreus]|uniref:C6 finger domain protein n=1 Tax=Aspergillus terreus TaxID=33178 RepID=A0A5M3Z153_ASPTE|nr:hypothetical protein ATETN484_0007029700 [Aspergillus terreus]GFF16102.1 C6 finger domain protein [Aspergillus terreus]
MVFCGKPSKGCGECRSRKIRCDQARPTCSQCIKGNRVCPGYRDELSLMFRDESQQVVRKAKTGSSGRRAKNTRKSTTHTSPSGSSSSQPSPQPPSKSSPPTATPKVSNDVSSDPPEIVNFNDLSYPQRSPESVQLLTPHSSPGLGLQPSYQFTKDEAYCFSLRNTEWPGSFWMMDFSPDFFRTTNEGSPSQQAMQASLVSVGSAMLSRIRQSGSLKIDAERDYGHALQLLTAAVMDEEEAKTNATLAAVLLLAIFEVVTSRTPRTIEKWTSHIYGAAALLELRGAEQLQDEDGLKLFVQLRFQIITSCLQRAAHVPRSVLECAKIAMYLRPQTEAYGDRLITIAGRLSNLRADINRKMRTDQREILSAAYAIEAELMAWVAGLPPEFMYTVVEHPSPDPFANMLGRTDSPCGNRYHIYHDLWLAHSWNQYRCARIIVSEIILGCLRRLSFRSPAMAISGELQNHCTRLRSSTRELARDICATVPFHFGIGNVGTKPSEYLPLNQAYLGGLLALWPLVLAGATEGKNHPLRVWVIHCLRIIGHTMGIDQALALIEVLETEVGIFDGIEDGENGVYFLEYGGTTAGNKVLTGTWGA